MHKKGPARAGPDLDAKGNGLVDVSRETQSTVEFLFAQVDDDLAIAVALGNHDFRWIDQEAFVRHSFDDAIRHNSILGRLSS